MAKNDIKYCEYFDVKEEYFPCIDESAINSGEFDWKTTYPHETFIKLLKATERMLGGMTNKSIWIHGAYGTGKSQCAYALKSILEVPEDELVDYWNRFDKLKREQALLGKIKGHKEQGILTAYRYASGSISTPQQLFFAVQESIKNAVEENDLEYKGEQSLKQSVISWLQDPTHNVFMDSLLQKPKWASTFSQSTADEIINTLSKSTEVSKLMNNIFALAAVEGITALDLTADSLIAWLKDIIEKNHVKIVLIWDEFSDYFRQNSNSLGEFQKLVSLCQEVPFYFIIVTHPISSLTSMNVADKNDPRSIVQQRFDRVEISLPDNIAFDLIGHAFAVKEAAKASWQIMTGDLNADVSSAVTQVMKTVNITDRKVMQDMLPLHPMAALILKNIASAFQSNQRSMFDFIKTTNDSDVKAFQWFIHNTSPLSDRPLLTIDMLWDFFYEKGKDYLSQDIKLILDTFPQQKNINENERIVLKTVLIMQAISQRLGNSISLLMPTDQNLSYAFEGDYPELESSCKNIAKSLVNKGILISTPFAEGKQVYAAAVLAGDSGKILEYKTELRKKTTDDLVSEGAEIAESLDLPHSLRLRYSDDMETGRIPVVTINTFKKKMDSLKYKTGGWRFYAVLALAKTDEEAINFRNLIKTTITNEEYRDLIVVDALSTPLGQEAFEQYVDYSAMSQYYSGNNGQQAKDNVRKAKRVIEVDWQKRIKEGSFIFYTYKHPEGEKGNGTDDVHSFLKEKVLNRFRYAQDYVSTFSESQLKLTTAKQIANYGFGGAEVKGVIKGCEQSVLGKFWKTPEYWKVDSLQSEAIVIIKKDLDAMILRAFKDSGKISVDEIWDYLQNKYGFAPCNLYVFITGFLLKEYNSDPYRSMDEHGHRDSMTPDKLADNLANYIGKDRPKTSYIVNLTPEEKAFYELAETAWSIDGDSCSSPSQVGALVTIKMRDFAYPAWCLEDVDSSGVYDIVKKFIDLVQKEGDAAHDIANEIGKIAIQRPSSANSLKQLLTADNCQKGMMLFLDRFENGKLITLAKEIGAEDNVLTDIKRLFSVQYSALWIDSTGEDEIRKLITEYELIKQTNILLNFSAHRIDDAFKAWRETLTFIGFSCEAFRTKFLNLSKTFEYLLKIYNFEDFLPEDKKAFLQELVAHNLEIRDILNNSTRVFMELYSAYLSDYTEAECEEIKNSITTVLFTATTTQSNAAVKKAAEDYNKGKLKTQLHKLWTEKTAGSKSPLDWSNKHRTPILCCVRSDIYNDAKKAFGILNGHGQSEVDIKYALTFIENADFFGDISKQEFIDEKFKEILIGEFSSLLSDINYVRDKLEGTGIDAYEWSENPVIKATIRDLAFVEYNAGGSDEAVGIIKEMPADELQRWLADIVRKDMGLGVKIIRNGKKDSNAE